MKGTRKTIFLGAIAALAIAGGLAWWQVALPGPLAFAGGRQVDLATYRGRSPTGVPSELASADPLTKGRYLTEAADCQACHTAKGGKPFAGGRAFKLPFGTIYTPTSRPTGRPVSGLGAMPNSCAPCTRASAAMASGSTRHSLTHPTPC
jgi:mono/diheme cytochrome c family protein